MSGVIRDAIDSYLERESSGDARLTRFRAAVAEAAGAAPELPPGEEYVDAIRPDYASQGEGALGRWSDPGPRHRPC